LMMSLWDALRMNMMISYQELVRTFPNILKANHIASRKGTKITSNCGGSNWKGSSIFYKRSFANSKFIKGKAETIGDN
ncbi:hypothetical protein ELK70_25280, partial [Klebsiella pneumoniae]|nr:hypothetical protein [Klebsiella pneumoniae]